MKEQKQNYKKYPCLRNYIDRIGAEENNFRKFLIKIHTGKYYIEKVIINISDDGDISCNNPEYAPDKEEKAAIKAELAKVEWPKSIGAPNIMKLKISRDQLFEFWDLNRNHIIMCQQCVRKDGDKEYFPWTFFSDGKWRCMEPDGKLPFWKPKEKRNKAKIMVHEGAKAASFVDGLINDPKRRAERKAHPWIDELIDYEHWGAIGGALAIQRANYAELHIEKPTEVVYVCDNDFPGKSALQVVSKCYGGTMKGIKFDSDFKNGWDMADDMPENYKKLNEYKQFATYATETVPVEKGRPLIVLKQDFIKEWVHAITPDVYIYIDEPSRILTCDEFDDKVQPFSGSKNTSQLVKGCDAIKSVHIKYIPGRPSGPYGQTFNTHVGGGIKEIDGDATPFLKFMEQLLPLESDRIETMRWCATLITHPEVKMLYALLLISETQGVGKGTLAERILKPIIGADNVSTPSEEEVVDSDYTYWQAHKRLAIIHEIYAGHSSKAYNKLKSLITDPVIRVKQKFLSPYEIDNWMHIIACSNNLNALKLTTDDRRWLVPKVTEGKNTQQYWLQFYHWLSDRNGLGIIIHWAKEFLETHAAVGKGEPAPWSTTKMAVIEENDSPGIQMVANILEIIRQSVVGSSAEHPDFERCIILDTDLVGLIHDNIPEREISFGDRQSAVRKAARGHGWFAQGEKCQLRDGTRGKLLCLDAQDASRPPRDLFRDIIPTRIRRLGKKFLVIDSETAELNVTRDELADPIAMEAMNKRNQNRGENS
jgi:hypothetical protein